MGSWDCIDRAEAAFPSFDEHLAHWLAWQPFALPSTPRHHLTVTAILGEGGRHGLARIAHLICSPSEHRRRSLC
jgi:hypothetical protein